MKLDTLQGISTICVSICLLLIAGQAEAEWGDDTRLTYDSAMSVTSGNNTRCIAASSDTLHIVWWDDRAGMYDYDVFYKRSTDNGITWGEDTPLTQHPGYQWVPSIAVENSYVHVVWRDNRDGNEEIYYRSSHDGGTTWLTEQRISNDVGWSDSPSIATVDSLVSVVWWDDRDGGKKIYFRQSYDFGTTWGEETRLTNSTAWSFSPCIAMEGSVIHIAWTDCRSGTEVYYKRSTDGGLTWGEDFWLTDSIGVSHFPSIDVSGSNVFVVWDDTRDGNDEVYIKHSENNGADWGSDTRLTDADDTSGAPTVTVSGSNVHVVWWDLRDGQKEIYYKKSSDLGVTWQRDTRLTNQVHWSLSPFAAVSGNYVHVIWFDWRFGNHEIFYKQDPAGNSGGTGFENFGELASYTQLEAVPNPFVTFTTVPGFETEDFLLYDISGRFIGKYKGNVIGTGLTGGIYFARCQTVDGIHCLRLVKLE